MAEQLLGSEMPKLIETPENEVHSIYRQEGAKTFDELALEIQTKRFSNAANIMGAGIISKSGMKDGDSPNTVLQNALITNNFADNCLNKNDIRNLSQVAKDDVYGNTLPVTYIDEVTKAMQKQQIDLGNFDRATELQLQRFNVTSVAIGR
ncbi:MAG: hypothetical protein K0R98_2067 [Rickettsiaceae bacterium]|nr:hypothetical protein [Rickettsiaceae bacterium]